MSDKDPGVSFGTAGEPENRAGDHSLVIELQTVMLHLPTLPGGEPWFSFRLSFKVDGYWLSWDISKAPASEYWLLCLLVEAGARALGVQAIHKGQGELKKWLTQTSTVE